MYIRNVLQEESFQLEILGLRICDVIATEVVERPRCCGEVTVSETDLTMAGRSQRMLRSHLMMGDVVASFGGYSIDKATQRGRLRKLGNRVAFRLPLANQKMGNRRSPLNVLTSTACRWSLVPQHSCRRRWPASRK